MHSSETVLFLQLFNEGCNGLSKKQCFKISEPIYEFSNESQGKNPFVPIKKAPQERL